MNSTSGMAKPCPIDKLIPTTSTMSTMSVAGRSKKHSKSKVFLYPIPPKSRKRSKSHQMPRTCSPPEQPRISVVSPNARITAAPQGMSEKIDEYRRMLKLVVSSVQACEEEEAQAKSQDFEIHRLPMAIRAELIIVNITSTASQLHTMVRCTEDTAIGANMLDVTPAVEKLRHNVRRWKWTMQEARRRKAILLLDKETEDLRRVRKNLLAERGQVLKMRKDMNVRLRLQSREKLKWKIAESSAYKHMSSLEASFEYIAEGFQPRSPSRQNCGSRSTPMLPSVSSPTNACAKQSVQVLLAVKAMKVAVTQTLRANREIESMIMFDKCLRKKLLAKIDYLLGSLALHRQLQVEEDGGGSGTQYGYHNAWCGPKAGDLIAYRATSKAMTYPDADTGIEFLKHITASSGMFPHMFLTDLPNRKELNALKFLGLEFMAYVNRTRGLERVFQLLQEVRMFHHVDRAVAYIVDMLCCSLRCERASYWIIDNEQGIAWTKFAAGGKEICIPISTGFVGSTVMTKSIVHVKDAYSDSRFNSDSDTATGFRTKSVLCAPILKSKFSAKTNDEVPPEEDTVIAVVQIVNKKSDLGFFDDTDIFMLSILGYGMTNVVLNCEQQELNLKTSHRKNVLLSFMWEMSLNCYAATDLLRIIKKYIQKMFLGMDASLMLTYYDHVQRLDVNDAHELVQTTAPKGIGLVGACVELRERIHVRDLSLDDRYNPAIDLLVGTATTRNEYSLHCLPLKRGALLSAVVQWVCPKRPRVDFGDDGLFNENNPRHIELIGKMMSQVHGLLETWYPLMDRLQKTSCD